MVKIPLVPAGNSPRGKTFQFLQKRHRDAYTNLTGSEKPTEHKLRQLKTLGVVLDFGEDEPISITSPTNDAV